jgi:hypothetical protein
MSEFGDIEQAVVDLLAALEVSGTPLFADVRGAALVDKRARETALQQALAPAAVVVVAGRVRRGSSDIVPAAVRVIVAIAERDLRSATGVRRGDVDRSGVFLLAQQTCAALDGVVAGSWRLSAGEEQLVAADDRHAVIELTILAELIDAAMAPTFGGDELIGTDSIVTVEVGERQREAVTYGFLGVDGEFQHVLGGGGQSIVWRGVLRADTHAALSAVEASLEALVAQGATDTLVDGYGVSRTDCVADAFVRRGPRRVHPTQGGVAQGFELSFVQLAVTA